MIELSEPVDNPALMAARMSAQVSRILQGRKVDVLLSAPNLMRLPIHDIALCPFMISHSKRGNYYDTGPEIEHRGWL